MTGTASNEAGRRRNNSHHTQAKVPVQPETAEAFKGKRRAKGVSMAGGTSRFMGGGNGRPDPRPTRRRRRKALVSIIVRLGEIRGAEKRHWGNVPTNPQNGERYEAAEQAYAAMEEALGPLHQAHWHAGAMFDDPDWQSERMWKGWKTPTETARRVGWHWTLPPLPHRRQGWGEHGFSHGVTLTI